MIDINKLTNRQWDLFSALRIKISTNHPHAQILLSYDRLVVRVRDDEYLRTVELLSYMQIAHDLGFELSMDYDQETRKLALIVAYA